MQYQKYSMVKPTATFNRKRKAIFENARKESCV